MKVETPTSAEPTTSTRKIVWMLPALTLLWLAITLWTSRGQISNSGGGTVALADAAFELPGVVQATLVAGAGLALMAPRLERAWIRAVMAAVAGLIAGGATAALVIAGYPHLPSIDSIAIMLGIAGALGGALTAIPRTEKAVTAGVAAALAALVVTTILNSNAVLSRMLKWFGAGSTPQSVIHASKLVQYTYYTIIGIVAGVVAFLYLRRRAVTAFATYLLAGALPGILMMFAFGLTQIGGARLLDAANSLSEADRLINNMESSETVPNAMIVLFIGAFVALIAFGRTLKPAAPATKAKASASRTPAPRSAR
jgi:hypothetical protein